MTEYISINASAHLMLLSRLVYSLSWKNIEISQQKGFYWRVGTNFKDHGSVSKMAKRTIELGYILKNNVSERLINKIGQSLMKFSSTKSYYLVSNIFTYNNCRARTSHAVDVKIASRYIGYDSLYYFIIIK